MKSQFSFSHELDGKLGAISGLLKSMANSHRLKMLCALSREEKTVQELIEVVGLSQSAVSQHLTWLKNQKVVTTRRERQKIYYSLTSEPCKAILTRLCEVYANKPQRSWLNKIFS